MAGLRRTPRTRQSGPGAGIDGDGAPAHGRGHPVGTAAPVVSGARRVDVIVGDVREPLSDPSVDRNPTTRVLARFTREVLTRDGDRYALDAALPAVDRDLYVRVRGTSTGDLEPRMDGPGENPWHDLWFYSNPIFIEVE